MRYIFFFPLLIMLTVLMSFAPKQHFGKQFSQEYADALVFFEKNRSLFDKTAKDYKIEVKALKAIIFPELLRYNLLQNLIETTALELLYVKGGTEAADFSIGHFQMKPSFAEKMEEIAADENNADWAEDFYALCSYGNTADDKSIRQKRIERLSDLDWQLRYLACFYKYSEKSTPSALTKKEKIELLAGRYNCGPDKTREEIKKIIQRASFPYGYSVNADIQYRYTDIATYFYEH